MIKLEDIKIGGNTTTSSNGKRVDSKDLNWDGVPDGKYNASLAIVYPWKDIKKDTKVRRRDDDGKYVKNPDGTFIMDDVKDLHWSFTNAIFKIEGGEYDGYAVKYDLSSHPNFVGSAKQFLYRTKLFDVSLSELYKHVGTPAIINVKNKTKTYINKDTGIEETVTESYVSYFDDMSDDIAGL